MTHTPHIPIAVALIVAVSLGCSAIQSVAPVVPSALPTATSQGGWHALQSQGFHALVPESFISGAQLDMASLLQTMRQLGPDYASAADSIQMQNLTYVAYAVDTHSNAAGRITSMLVGRVSAPSTADISQYTEALAKKLLAGSSEYHLIGKQIQSTGRYPVGMLAVEIRTPQTPGVTQAIYAAQHGGVFWHIVFTTPSAEYASRAAVFEQISSSVTLPYSPLAPTATGLPVTLLLGLGLLILLAVVVLALAVMFYARSRSQAAAAPVVEHAPAPAPAAEPAQSATEAKAAAEPAAPTPPETAAPAPKKPSAARKRSPARKTATAKPRRKSAASKSARPVSRKKPKKARKP